jgi:hypothetical protein
MESEAFTSGRHPIRDNLTPAAVSTERQPAFLILKAVIRGSLVVPLYLA